MVMQNVGYIYILHVHHCMMYFEWLSNFKYRQRNKVDKKLRKDCCMMVGVMILSGNCKMGMDTSTCAIPLSLQQNP